MFRILSLILVLILTNGCNYEETASVNKTFAISDLQTNEILIINYSTDGHSSEREKFIFTNSLVEVRGNQKLKLLPSEIKTLDEYIMVVEKDDGKGRCSIRTKMKLKIVRNGKTLKHKSIVDTYCSDDSKKITLEALSQYSKNTFNELYWRTGNSPSLIEE